MRPPRIPRGGRLIAAALVILAQPAIAGDTASSATVSTVHTSSTDLSAYVQILHDGTNWTMLPRGSVLHLPESLRPKLDGRPVGNLVSWSEFRRINSEWIAAEEITLRQAEGTRPIDPRRLSYLSEQNRIIVAVHEGGPIRVSDAE